MTNPPPGAPDYFALFQSMFTPGGTAPAPASVSPPMFAMLDPKELERKISELETVLAWLKATTGMIEMSLQTMKYQQSLLASFADGKSQQDEAVKQPDMEELAKMASAMNPALWAFNMMQAPQGGMGGSRPLKESVKAARNPLPAAGKSKRAKRK